MKYCLSSRQTKKYLDMTDEIMVESRDYRQVSDLFIEHPDKMIILDIDNEMIENEDKMKVVEQYGQASENFCCVIYDLRYIGWFKDNNIKFYYGYPISSYYDVEGLIALGVEYIKVMAPLTFDMEVLKSKKAKFRMVPNVAYDAYIPRADGLCGQWVRPEDVKYYEEGIYVFEFEDKNLDKERTLYDIYAIKQKWEGNLYFLFTNFNFHADNKIIPDDIGQVRARCRQRCMSHGSCHYCDMAFKFERTLRENKDWIKEQIAKQKENN